MLLLKLNKVSMLVVIIPVLISSLKCHPQQKKGNTAKIITIRNCSNESKLAVGDTIIVELVEVPGTGYSWSIKENPKNVKALKFVNKTIEDPVDTNDNTRRKIFFKFILTAASHLVLEFEYKRPWEKNASPANNCKLNLDIL